MKRAQILVVGAGLGGLALARVLGQAGLAPQVIERASGWEMAGTGIYPPANGVRALQALGLEQAVAARAVEIPRQRLLEHRGRLLAEIDAGTVADALAGFVARRSPRTDWVRAQTHRRDRTRNLPPAMRNLILRAFGRRIFRLASASSRCS